MRPNRASQTQAAVGPSLMPDAPPIRADFYSHQGGITEWLGSVRVRGDYWAMRYKHPLMRARTKAEFVAAVEAVRRRWGNDFVSPRDGWPWPAPHDSSRETEYAYAMQSQRVHMYRFGAAWAPDLLGQRVHWAGTKSSWFPNMAWRRRAIV